MLSAEYRSLQARFQQQGNTSLSQTPGTPTCLSNYHRERSLSKMRKSLMRNSSISGSPVKDRSCQNIEDLERQWNQVKELHNHFQNNVNSPLRTKYCSNQPSQRLSESQVKNFNVMKLVPHYRINLELNENEEINNQRMDYMGAIVQKYGNIHKRSSAADSPANQVRVRNLNRNDLKEVKRQASTSASRSKLRTNPQSQTELKHCQSEVSQKFPPPMQYNFSGSFMAQQNCQPMHPQIQQQMQNLQNVPVSQLQMCGAFLEQQYQAQQQKKQMKTSQQTLTKVMQPVGLKKSLKGDNRGQSTQNFFKPQCLPNPSQTFQYYDNQQILNHITNPKNQTKAKSILQTPESTKKPDLTPQKRRNKQLSPRVFKERNGR